MPEDRRRHCLDVFRSDEAAPAQERMGLGCLRQSQGRPWGRAEQDQWLALREPCILWSARGEHQVHDVIARGLREEDPIHADPGTQHLFRICHGLRLRWTARMGHALDDLGFLLAVRGMHHHLQQETVDLRLRQGIGAFQFDRVLGGEDQEGLRQRPCIPRQAHLTLLHRLQQGGLHLRWGAVDLIGKQEIAENRPLTHAPFAAAGVVDVGTEQIRWQQVGGELNAPEAAAHGSGKGLDGKGLGQPRQPFEQQVAIGEEGDQQGLDQLLLTHQDTLHLPAEIVQEGAILRDLLLDFPDTFHERSITARSW